MSFNQYVYDFLSDENEPKWKGLLTPALRKVSVYTIAFELPSRVSYKQTRIKNRLARNSLLLCEVSYSLCILCV